MAAVIEGTAVGWVKPAHPITGLDHLGSVAPCIAIYSTLLPGITNVTDRARYYSFYPWFLWKYTQAGEPIESSRFHELYRRADCLFTLVAENHAETVGGDASPHGSRMVGRDTLVPALRELVAGKSLRLSDFATQDEHGKRYFKNRLGGLGQYYLGTLEDLGILAGRSGDFVQYDKDIGAEIARRFDVGIPGKLFWDTICKDSVTTKVLAQLAPLCPCQLSRNTAEHAWLKDLFFGNLGDDPTSRHRRSRSLALILDLTLKIQSDPNTAIDPAVFRDACYTGSLPDGTPWDAPSSLLPIRDEWRIYERNELLSVGCQALLTAFVRALDLMPKAPASASEVARFLLGAPALSRLAKKAWPQFVAEYSKALPALTDHAHNDHEIAVARRLFEVDVQGGATKELAATIANVLQLFAILAIRANTIEHGPYGALPITTSTLADYPINLITFGQAEQGWKSLSVAGVVDWLLSEWVCETHLRIALRKLRFERLDTFRFYPTDDGFKAREVPGFDYSNPRVRQAIQILRDLSALEADAGGRMQITAVGRQYMEDVCRS